MATKRIMVAIVSAAIEREIVARPMTRADVCDSFGLAETATKYEIVDAVAELVPEIRYRTLTKRNAWQSEKYSMPLFESFALALAFLALADG